MVHKMKGILVDTTMVKGNEELPTKTDHLLQDIENTNTCSNTDCQNPSVTTGLCKGDVAPHHIYSGSARSVHILHRTNRCAHWRNVKQWDCSDEAFKRRAMKNVYVIGCVFALLFTSIAALVNLQSSLFIDQGLGVVCQSINYVALALSSLFLPKIMISRLGYRWTLVIALHGCVAWMAANGYANWVTMITASVIVGICSAPMWTVFGAFLTVLAGQYATRTGKDKAQTVSLFFGIALGLLKTSRLFGSLLSWGVLQNSMKNSSVVSEETMESCGQYDCPWLHTGNVYYEGPQPYILWTLVGICLVIGISTIFITVLLMDELPVTWSEVSESRDDSDVDDVVTALLAASKLHSNIKQLLVIPISLYMGLSVSFIQADFNKSYVTCALGIWMVGLVLLPSAILSVATAFLSGRIGRGFLQFIFGFLLDMSILVTCLLWRPSLDTMPVLFVISGLFGVTSTLWHTQVNALVGVVFSDKESAMANCMMWQSIGFSVSFGMSRSVCVYVKIYTTASMLTVAMICLIVLQLLIRKESKSMKQSEEIDVSDEINDATETARVEA